MNHEYTTNMVAKPEKTFFMPQFSVNAGFIYSAVLLPPIYFEEIDFVRKARLVINEGASIFYDEEVVEAVSELVRVGFYTETQAGRVIDKFESMNQRPLTEANSIIQRMIKTKGE